MVNVTFGSQQEDDSLDGLSGKSVHKTGHEERHPSLFCGLLDFAKTYIGIPAKLVFQELEALVGVRIQDVIRSKCSVPCSNVKIVPIDAMPMPTKQQELTCAVAPSVGTQSVDGPIQKAYNSEDVHGVFFTDVFLNANFHN
jgi:hypothetical protein